MAEKDDLTHLLYDDQCHLKKFSENPERADSNEITKKVAKLEKYVDKFHFREAILLKSNSQLVRFLVTPTVRTDLCFKQIS